MSGEEKIFVNYTIGIPQSVKEPNMVVIGADEYSVEDYTIPSERTFREAWEAPESGSKVIGVSMSKAKNVWKDKIRAARVPEFEKLDTDYTRAIETDNTSEQAAIIAKKQVLRDAPAHPDIEKATTTDELKKVQPIPGVTVE